MVSMGNLHSWDHLGGWDQYLELLELQSIPINMFDTYGIAISIICRFNFVVLALFFFFLGDRVKTHQHFW